MAAVFSTAAFIVQTEFLLELSEHILGIVVVVGIVIAHEGGKSIIGTHAEVGTVAIVAEQSVTMGIESAIATECVEPVYAGKCQGTAVRAKGAERIVWIVVETSIAESGAKVAGQIFGFYPYTVAHDDDVVERGVIGRGIPEGIGIVNAVEVAHAIGQIAHSVHSQLIGPVVILDQYILIGIARGAVLFVNDHRINVLLASLLQDVFGIIVIGHVVLLLYLTVGRLVQFVSYSSLLQAG